MEQNEIQFILYNMPGEDGKVQVVIKDETIWATQKAMAQLFGCSTDNIGLHLKNIFTSEELDKDSVTEKISATAADGKKYLTAFYSLDAIIAVGYRVSSARATKFRQWATKILKEYIKKGFVLDDDRLKQGTDVFGVDYFRELLERVRSIRASERRIWQQITDIYAEYLPEKQIHQLERAVSSYFDYIENQIERQNAFTMEQFAKSVDKFLTFNDYKILPGKGTVSAAQAKAKAESEYDIFNKTQRIDSDFDKQLRIMFGNK